jgi:hypothetical protein
MSETFEQANQHIHTVESQWHYPILTKFGFVPLDKTGIGFIRQYRYQHPVTHFIMCINTGVYADYWTDETHGGFGYWAALEPHLKKMSENVADGFVKAV